MRARKDELGLLKKVPLFEGLTNRHLKIVRDQAQEERFPAGKVIVKQGTTGGRFYVITEGRAKVLIGGKNRKTLRPGDFFGEMSLIDRGERTASVVAETPVRTLSLSSWNFMSLLQEEWSMAHKVMLVLSRRIRDLEKATATH